jgi:hypothetical protein
VELFAFVVGCEYDAWTYYVVRASDWHFHVEKQLMPKGVHEILVLDANSKRAKISSTMLVC